MIWEGAPVFAASPFFYAIVAEVQMTAAKARIRNRRPPGPALLNRALLCLSLTLAVGLAGCVPHPAPVPLPPPAAPVAPTVQPKPVKASPPPVATTRLAEQLPPTILLSDASRAYTDLADRLGRRLGPGTTVVVLDAAHTPQLPGNGPLVAIGLEAAIAARPYANRRDVAFALVFNHGDHRLLDQGLIGVSMLPPPQQVLRTFKSLCPATSNIVLPCGPNLDEYLGQAQREASRLGLTLTANTVHSDKELLLAVKQLGQSGTVLWLLPDNRIVSRDSLQQIMASNIRAGRPTVVFSPSLFKIGGLLSAEYDANAVAETILAILKKNPEERAKLKGTMLHPQQGTLAINGSMAETLGLSVPTMLENLLRKP